MSKGKGTLIQDTIPQAPRKPTAQDFAAEYWALCERMGYQMTGQPAFKPMGELGGYLTVVQMMIVPYQKTPQQG
jgi:hypothetical protein